MENVSILLEQYAIKCGKKNQLFGKYVHEIFIYI